MKKVLILFLCFFFTSCFEITERIKHSSDQSGNYSLVVDFSKSWFKTKSAIWLEEVDGVSIPNEDDIKGKLTDFRSKASKIDGITGISTKYDFENYIFSIKFSYQNITALNAVLNSMDKQGSLTHFSSSKDNVFERSANYPLPKNLLKNDDKKADLENANITSIYSFEKEIIKVNNPNSKLSKNKKTVFLKQNVYNVLRSNSIMNNTIYF